MNIRVALNTPIYDGAEVVFRSPVDCSQVTGLIVYYPENGNPTSKEFAFADAHGNNVGDIDHLFAENVVVKVILDVTTSMAFVQNADTNAYLEGRFAELDEELLRIYANCKTNEVYIGYNADTNEGGGDLTYGDYWDLVVNQERIHAYLILTYQKGVYKANTQTVYADEDSYVIFDFADLGKMRIDSDNVWSFVPVDNVTKEQMDKALSASELELIDKLCPSFTESGAFVTCEPVKGYPLEITTEEEATTVTRVRGKNLFGGDALANKLVSLNGGAEKDTDNGTISFTAKDMGTKLLFNKFKENTQYTFIFYGTNTGDSRQANLAIYYTDGSTAEEVKFPVKGQKGTIIVKSAAGKTVARIGTYYYSGTTVLYYDQCGIFEGNVSADAFEPYHGEIFEKGEQVLALDGVNTIWADKGEITVSGRADPVARLERLENAILAMGANV